MERHELSGEQKITVQRESTGFLRVKARTRADLFRGLGFCHAHDRGLQMLLLRILGQGRGSELLVADAKMLEIDKFFRKANFTRGAPDEIQKLDAGERALIKAYCDGINGVILKRAPWEFKLFGYKPAPWEPADSVMLSRLISYVSLAQTQGDLERLLLEMLQAGVTREHLEELFPGQLTGLDVDLVRRVRLGERVVPSAVAWAGAVPKAVASNNWVVAPRKSKSGKALIASDPHLEVNTLPAVWYECALELVGGKEPAFAMGAGMPGLPAILIGRNAALAWGVTYSFLDGVDSWMEEVKDGKYRRDEGKKTSWQEFRVRREVIKRKKAADLSLEFFENDHGTLDGDPRQDGLLLATKWASLDGSGAQSIKAMMGLLDARTAEQGLGLLGQLETAWNWVAADGAGHIGYQMSGRLPVRRDGISGLVPLPGWLPENDWQGFAPATDLPRAFDPPAGFFTTANQDLSFCAKRRAQNSPMGPWRSDRIAEALAARDDWDVEGFRQLQLDLHSRQADAYLKILLPFVKDEPAAEPLRTWDRRCTLDSTAATLFERFYRHLFDSIVGHTVGPGVAKHLGDETGMLADFYDAFDRILLSPKTRWLGGRSQAEVWRGAFKRAAAEPVRTWREHQTVMMSHMLFGGKLPRFLGFDHGPIAIQGSRSTVHQGQIYRNGDRLSSFAPSYRMVADLGERGIHSVLAGGHSDRRFSPWYVSDVARWLGGKLKDVLADPP